MNKEVQLQEDQQGHTPQTIPWTLHCISSYHTQI